MSDGTQAPLAQQAGPAALPSPDPPLVLAVPNVSEGRDAHTIATLRAACEVPGVRVVRVDSDVDHHRSVLTLVGDPLAIQDALVALAWEAMERIDLRRHRGVHPRVGALDVAPIVALTDDELPLARELATAVSERIGWDLGLPVFRYGAIAATEGRVRPHHFRANGLDWLGEEIAGGRMIPDAGPPRLHPTAGAVLVGARGPLIAFNMWLPEAGLQEARVIAARVREAGGGPPGLRALGLYLPEAGAAQVSMNIEDYRRTPLWTAVRAVRREAERLGVLVGESELIGTIPAAALAGPSPAVLGIRGMTPGRVIDAHLRRGGAGGASAAAERVAERW